MIGPRDNVFPGPAVALDGPDAVQFVHCPMQENDWDELTVTMSKESKTNEDDKPSDKNSSNDGQSQTSAERRRRSSAIRQQQNKRKQKAESATGSAHAAAPCTF